MVRAVETTVSVHQHLLLRIFILVAARASQNGASAQPYVFVSSSGAQCEAHKPAVG